MSRAAAVFAFVGCVFVACSGEGSSSGKGTGGGGDKTPVDGAAPNADGGGGPMGGDDAAVSTDGAIASTDGASSEAGPIPGGPLVDRITKTDLTAPAGVKAGVSNERVWGPSSLVVAPVFTVPLADCGTLVGYTTGTSSAPTAMVARLDASDHLVSTWTLQAGRELRGLAAEGDGHFGALLWDDANDKIYVARFDKSGAAGWTTELTNTDNSPTDFGIGDSRLEYGNGQYGAYYHVHSTSGHEGDTLKWVDAAQGTVATGGWTWGCSHSMSTLLRYNTALTQFLPVCVTDCYPGTSGSDFKTVSQGGLYLNDKTKVIDIDAGCDGHVAGELGGAAASAAGWKLVFNAHQSPLVLGQSSYSTATDNQDIGFASVTKTTSGSVVWLTTTAAVSEQNPSIAPWHPTGDGAEQYLVGWAEASKPKVYRLARVDGAGHFLEQPADVTSHARWGERDDPFREHVNHDVVWAWFDAAGATSFHLARVRSGQTATCATF